MTERIPASLAYLLIYNPTLPPPTTTSRDDEDAQEEAHILFYTSRDRVTSRDRMLRQVGLAKALVTFSDIFSPGQGCDNVHSQSKRMVSISPEPDFWMHVCVDLAKTPKQRKDKSKVKSGRDIPVPSVSQLYYYHEDSVFDQVLRDSLLNGYEMFKLLYGTFSSILKDGNPEPLQTHLERFFTPWAWRWNLKDSNDLYSHLGLFLHPLSNSVMPKISSFIKELPPATHLILVSPPYIIPCSSDSEFVYPSSLAKYLLSLTPLTDRSSQDRMSIQGKQPQEDRLNNKDLNSGGGNNTLRFFRDGLGDVMNVKRWTWSGTLGFGGTASKPSQQINEAVPPNTLIDKPDGTFNAGGAKPEEPTDNQPNSPDLSTHEQPSIGHPVVQDTVSSSLPHEDLVLSQGSQTLLPTDIKNNEVDDGLAAAPKRTFIVDSVRVFEPTTPLIPRERRLLRLTEADLTLALLVDLGWLARVDERSLSDLACRCGAFLRQVRDTLNKQPEKSNNDVVNAKFGVDKSKAIISFDRRLTSHGKIPAAAAPYFLENQSLMLKDTNVLEVFSRSVASQNWVVTKRGIALPNNGDGGQREAAAFMMVDNQGASLVDADNELEGIVRRWKEGAM